MRTYDFSISDEPKNNEINYVILKAGKGKADKSIIYIPFSGFSYLEGLIWDKFREYDSTRQAKIPSREWNRILEGFQTAFEKLQNLDKSSLIQKILKFEIVQPEYPIIDIENQLTEVEGLIQELIRWVSNFTKSEKYIFITRSHR